VRRPPWLSPAIERDATGNSGGTCVPFFFPVDGSYFAATLAMVYLTAFVRIFLLAVFFLFAQKNFELATLRFYFDLEWRAPLILMLLLFFVLGVVLTLIALLPRLLRMRRGPARPEPPADAAQ